MRVALAVVALSLVACGGADELERFRTDQLRPVRVAVEEDRAAVARLVGSVQLGNAGDARLLTAAVDRLQAHAGELRALRPPTEVAAAVEGYAAAIEQVAEGLRAYARAVANGRRTDARAAATASRAAVDRLVRRARTLDREVSDDA